MLLNKTAHIKKLIKSKTLMNYLINSLGHLELFKYELIVRANDLVIKITFLQPRSNVTAKDESNPNRLDQMAEQKYR